MRLSRSRTSTGSRLRARRTAAASLTAVIAAVSMTGSALASSARHPGHHTTHQALRAMLHSRHVRSATDQRGCANANQTAVEASTKTIRTAVVCLINQQRVSRGLPALRTSWRLDRSAQGWTNTLVATQSFSHGSDFAGRISAAGFSWSSAGENIATGYPTSAAVVSAWMASTDHCQNVLNPTYSYVGTGLARRAIKPYGSRPATWTQDFALPLTDYAPSGNWAPAHGCPYK